uniref:Uncharacterized protein n=1 Tax=Arundo donax TaxID=35708 RepID=A0A0A9EZZ5_ARUDO
MDPPVNVKLVPGLSSNRPIGSVPRCHHIKRGRHRLLLSQLSALRIVQ